MKKLNILFIVILGLFILNNAFAMEEGFTLGLGGGLTRLDTPSDYAFSVTGMDSRYVYSAEYSNKRDLGGLGYQLFSGYNFNQYFGLLGEFVLPQKSEYSASSYDNDDKFDAKLKYTAWAVNLLAKGQLPLGKSGLNLVGQGGLAYISQSVDYSNNDTVGKSIALNRKAFSRDLKPGDSTTQSAIRPVFGFGLSYDFNQNFALTAMFERVMGSGDFKTDKNAVADINTAFLGLSYAFTDPKGPTLLTDG